MYNSMSSIKFCGNSQKTAKRDINQARSALLQGKIERFRLDSLIDMAHRLDLNVSIRLAS